MAVEAARRVLATVPVVPKVLVHATPVPAYLDKSNASAVHAAVGLAAEVPAYDVSGATRSATAAFDAALAWGRAGRPTLLAVADMRTGQPGSSDEAQGGDAAVALVVGSSRVAGEVIEGREAIRRANCNVCSDSSAVGNTLLTMPSR